jgi:hypothetical protein
MSAESKRFVACLWFVVGMPAIVTFFWWIFT